MWEAKTSFDYLGIVSDKKKKLIHDVCENFTIPSKGIVLLFDKFNYKNYPKTSIWRNLGNHLNIELGDGCDHKTPKSIKKLADSKSFSHIIWLSQRAWSSTKIDFVWNLSHELRHIEQDIENRVLSLVGYFLYNNLKGLDIDEPKIPNTVPTELDAELAAWRVSRQVINRTDADEYVLKNTKSGKKQDDFRVLIKHNPNAPYNVIAETISLMRKYQPQLDEIINEAPSFYFQELRNIDYMTLKLSRNQQAEP